MLSEKVKEEMKARGLVSALFMNQFTCDVLKEGKDYPLIEDTIIVSEDVEDGKVVAIDLQGYNIKK